MVKNIIIGALAVLVVVFAILYLKAPTTVLQPAPVGAIPGVSVDSNCFSIGGVETCYFNKGLTSGTTTPCAIQITASSTLLEYHIQTTNASSTASKLTFARASTFNSTTTSLGTATITANQKAYFASSTMYVAGRANIDEDSNAVFKPGQWFVIGQQGGTAASGASPFSVTGNCIAIFRLR